MHPASSQFSRFFLALAMTGAIAACGGSVEPTGTGDPSGTSPGSSSTSTDGTSSSSGNKTSPVVKPGTGNGPDSAQPSTPDCTYPVITNPPECPPAYTRQPPPSCATIGLKCWYPGVGDGDSRGCWSTALLACVADTGSDGGPGETGHWVGAQ